MPPSEWRRGSKEDHEAHHRPTPLRSDATEDARLPGCPGCGKTMGLPFATEVRVVETIAPGYVRVTRYRIGRDSKSPAAHRAA